MFHAGRNFNHHVQEKREKEHKLVTTGTVSQSIFFHPINVWNYFSDPSLQKVPDPALQYSI
jgi:hypothetical protein